MENNKFYSLSENVLIATSGIIWLIAGVNILRLGIISYLELDSIPFYYCLLSVVVFIPFGLMFKRMTEKHTKRNKGYQEKMPI